MSEEQPKVIRIMAISIVSSQKYKTYAVYDGENLIITQVDAIQWNDISWKANLITELVARINAAWPENAPTTCTSKG